MEWLVTENIVGKNYQGFGSVRAHSTRNTVRTCKGVDDDDDDEILPLTPC